MRPTQDQLLAALGHIEQLAYRYDSRNNPNGFPDVVTFVDLLLWVDTELEAAKDAAALGAGSSDLAHTIGRHGLIRPVEERFHWGNGARPHLRDPFYRALRELQAGWLADLGQRVDAMRDQSTEAGNWPERTRDTGT